MTRPASRRSPWLAAAVFLTGGLLVACGGSTAATSPETEGCEHAGGGPFGAATATEDLSAAPLVELEHKSTTVTLAAIGGGYIKFEVDEAGEHVIYLDRNVAINVKDAGGRDVPIESTETLIKRCPELVKVYYVLELAAGVHSLEFVASPTGEVKVVLAPAGDRHHH